jgi:Protein of unknown function (DUF4239)
MIRAALSRTGLSAFLLHCYFWQVQTGDAALKIAGARKRLIKMKSVGISLAVFACTFGGALLGLPRRLPKDEFRDDTIRVITLTTGMVVTMASIVIGMLVSSARASYEVRHQELIQIASKVVMLDRILANYGPEAQEARAQLRYAIESGLQQTWGDSSVARVQLRPAHQVETLYEKVLALVPKTPEQTSNKAGALTLAMDLQQMRWLILVQSGSESASLPMLVILTLWLTVVFISFGLLAPSNRTVTVALFVSALAVSTAIFLIVDMSNPLGGVLKLSPEPLRAALAQLGR